MIIAEVVRSGFVESVHHGSVVVLPSGESVGDVAGPMFPRSSNKPMQTVGMLRAGLTVPDEDMLAQISASHFGESFHVRMVREILASAGLGTDALRCPAAAPLATGERGEPDRVFMNCSGKHAGMLSTCVANGWPLESYLEPKHPLQLALADAVADLAGEPIAMTGVDGCGAPVFGFSLTGLARAFQRLVEAAPGSFERRVADAMRARPELVAGTGVDDTVLMARMPGLLAKGGAEGVVAAAVPGVGAVAIKIEDGGMRARTPVLLSALRRLGLEPPQVGEPILGGGEPVGEVRSVW